MPLEIPEALISNDALRIVEKLNEMGHLSYVVGGCVRDLALGTEPKDFDVVTTAAAAGATSFSVRSDHRSTLSAGACPLRTPPPDRGGDLRAQVPEVEDGDDLLVREDNEYDRRWRTPMARFTVNGLYDPLSGSVVDYVDGLKDPGVRSFEASVTDKRIQETRSGSCALRLREVGSRWTAS